MRLETQRKPPPPLAGGGWGEGEHPLPPRELLPSSALATAIAAMTPSGASLSVCYVPGPRPQCGSWSTTAKQHRS
jgi:hypothetical protein